ncbi:MAG: protein tyrosine phosphatase [Isosphaerales bacterium]
MKRSLSARNLGSARFPLPTHPSSFILHPFRRRHWPWLVLALMAIPAVWHVLDFDEDVDTEFPAVVRPTFSRVPPSAYRLAEPGDTLDRIMIYMSAASVVLATAGLFLHRGAGLWHAGLALSLACLWYSATPGPAVDGWYGLGWRSIFDPRAPLDVRAGLLLAALALASVVAVTMFRRRHHLRDLWAHAQDKGTSRLWVAALVLVIARQFEVPGVEPEGYWPRCAMIFGLLAFDLGLVIELAPGFRTTARPLLVLPLFLPAWLVLVVAGIALTWYHRPLARLKVVEPGRIYISAMPTLRGLRVAQARHPFRTIINLFPEDTPQGSPLLPDELRFAREHGIRYVGSPSDRSEDASNAFLDQTLALAQDPSAWPILVHCHGCMDRSPAWMGIYKFVVKERPLREVMQEIERHRGYRPKASVILLYNRVLPPRAGERYWTDPTAALLRECAAGALEEPPRVTTKSGTAARPANRRAH